MRLYIDGKNTKTIRMYAEAQVEADKGADVVIKYPEIFTRPMKETRVLPRVAVVDDALAGIEFVSALKVKE